MTAIPFDFDDEGLRRLNLMAAKMKTNRGDVITSALRILEALIEAGEGVEIVYEKDGVVHMKRVFE